MFGLLYRRERVPASGLRIINKLCSNHFLICLEAVHTSPALGFVRVFESQRNYATFSVGESHNGFEYCSQLARQAFTLKLTAFGP